MFVSPAFSVRFVALDARLPLALSGLISTILLAGCLPGGAIAPMPFPHYDRPTVHGILVEAGLPVEGMTIRATSFDASDALPPEACNEYQAQGVTDFRGEFEIRGDLDLITIWWDAGNHGPDTLALCLPAAISDARWQTRLDRKAHPPWLPGELEITCSLQKDRTVLRCDVSQEEF